MIRKGLTTLGITLSSLFFLASVALAQDPTPNAAVQTVITDAGTRARVEGVAALGSATPAAMVIFGALFGIGILFLLVKKARRA